MILKIIGAILGVIGGSIYLKAPKSTLGYAGILGALGWIIYLITLNLTNETMAVFITGLSIALLSHLLARTTKTPITIFLIPGFLTLVPGMALYYSVRYFMEGSPLASDSLRTTLGISGLIALAIFIVDSLIKPLDRS